MVGVLHGAGWAGSGDVNGEGEGNTALGVMGVNRIVLTRPRLRRGSGNGSRGGIEIEAGWEGEVITGLASAPRKGHACPCDAWNRGHGLIDATEYSVAGAITETGGCLRICPERETQQAKNRLRSFHCGFPYRKSKKQKMFLNAMTLKIS